MGIYKEPVEQGKRQAFVPERGPAGRYYNVLRNEL